MLNPWEYLDGNGIEYVLLCVCRLKSHREELKEKEQSWKECEKSYKKEREVLDKAERELNKLQVSK